MEEGFIPGPMHVGSVAPTWISGKPEYGFLGLKTPGQRTVQTFRCIKCGYLESYAPGMTQRSIGVWPMVAVPRMREFKIHTGHGDDHVDSIWGKLLRTATDL